MGLTLLGTSCRRAEKEEGDFGAVSYSIETRITPERGSIEQRSEIKRTKTSASVTWVIRTGSSWPEYRAEVATRLGGEGGFDIKSENASQVVFSRRLPADVHTLTVEILEAGPPVRVRVTLEAAAW